MVRRSASSTKVVRGDVASTGVVLDDASSTQKVFAATGGTRLHSFVGTRTFTVSAQNGCETYLSTSHRNSAYGTGQVQGGLLGTPLHGCDASRCLDNGGSAEQCRWH